MWGGWEGEVGGWRVGLGVVFSQVIQALPQGIQGRMCEHSSRALPAERGPAAGRRGFRC